MKNRRISPDEITGLQAELDAGFGVRDLYGGEADALSAQDMSSEFASLTVRQNRRREIAIAAHIAVTKEHAEIVRLAPGAATRAGWFDATVVDASEGGLGFVSELFVPRGCLVDVDIRNPLNTDESLLTSRMRIKRVLMIDRRPGYLIGGIFEGNTDDFQTRLDGFLAIIDGIDTA